MTDQTITTNPEETRIALAAKQAAVVRALVGKDSIPPGFCSLRIRAVAHSLVQKRYRSVAEAWPQLAASLGPKFRTLFVEYSEAVPLPAHGPLADGRSFADWLKDRQTLPDEAQVAVMAFDFRNARGPDGFRRRLSPAFKGIWLRRTRRLVLAIRLPLIGERWFSISTTRGRR